ncbi:class I SAM-dependent methyltransferase [Sphingomonas sp. R86520]|uniref:class I SAM-dependent methyltransferase n=1 Tax=Sphingomonas sp. R86520 TaxID=3093859 RepID=UPI0036D40318
MLNRLLHREYQPSAGDWDREYASGHWRYLAGLPEMARMAVIVGYAAAAGSPNPVILDVGCGEGTLLKALRDLPYRTYRGIDLSPVAIERARASAGPRDSFEAVGADVLTPDEAPDIIIFNEVLYYLKDVEQLVSRYLSMLGPEGIAIVSVHVRRRHNHIWRSLGRVGRIVDQVMVRHSIGTAWQIALIKPPE